MPIQFNCPSCDRRYQLDYKAAGKLATCPCGETITVPQPNIDDAEQPLRLAEFAKTEVGMYALRVEQLLEQLIQINGQIHDRLTEVVDEVQSANSELDWQRPGSAVNMLLNTLDWTKESDSAAMILKAIENVEEAVREG